MMEAVFKSVWYILYGGLHFVTNVHFALNRNEGVSQLFEEIRW